MQYTVIIPARYNSLRFPGKALYSISGKPLILRTLHCSKSRNGTYVATDDKRIYDAVTKDGGCAVMTSPTHESGTDRVAEAARHLKLPPEEIIVNIQGDQPFIPTNLPKILASALKAFPSYSIATPVINKTLTEQELLDNNLVKAALQTDGQTIGYFYRKVELEMCPPQILKRLRKHVGVYAYRNEFIQAFTQMECTPNECFFKLEQLRAIDNGYKILAVAIDENIHDVNTPKDVVEVESWLKENGNGRA